MEKQSWLCTVATQLSLCFALYVALNMGQSQKAIYGRRGDSRSVDLYFVSVNGGFRPPREQTHLLKRMEKVVKIYDARFVISVSELGEDDPLVQNGTWYFHSLKVPWYATRAFKGQGADYFLRQIKIAHGKTLDVIALDTASLQDPSSVTGKDQLRWLTSILEASNSNWKIVVGLHPPSPCVENIEQMEGKEILEPLCNILVEYGVNAYLSGQACANYVCDGTISHISVANLEEEGPYSTSINQRLILNRKMFNGFLLHRVSPLEIVTYFVTSTGEIVHKTTLQQKGKEVI